MYIRRSCTTLQRKSARGFTLAEVGLATAVLVLMGLLFGAAVPSILRTPQFSSNYTQAGELAQHKVDQLRAAGYSTLTQSSQLQGLGIINAINPDGTYDFTTADNLSSFFPDGSTGTLTLTADPNAPAQTVMDIAVTITWTGSTFRGGTYTTRTMISN